MDNPVCSCGKKSVKKDFATFSYFYCEICKVEVEGKAAKDGVKCSGEEYGYPPLHVYTGNLPQGYAALKGEDVTCYLCKDVIGHLNQDLPEINSRGAFTNTYIDYTGNLCKCTMCDHKQLINFSGFKERFHIKSRGWV